MLSGMNREEDLSPTFGASLCEAADKAAVEASRWRKEETAAQRHMLPDGDARGDLRCRAAADASDSDTGTNLKRWMPALEGTNWPMMSSLETPERGKEGVASVTCVEKDLPTRAK